MQNRIEKIAKKLLQSEESGDFVGRVGPKTLKQFRDHVSAETRVELQLQIMQMQRRQLWYKIAEELGVDPEGVYRLDPETGDVYRLEDDDETTLYQ